MPCLHCLLRFALSATLSLCLILSRRLVGAYQRLARAKEALDITFQNEELFPKGQINALVRDLLLGQGLEVRIETPGSSTGSAVRKPKEHYMLSEAGKLKAAVKQLDLVVQLLKPKHMHMESSTRT